MNSYVIFHYLLHSFPTFYHLCIKAVHIISSQSSQQVTEQGVTVLITRQWIAAQSSRKLFIIFHCLKYLHKRKNKDTLFIIYHFFDIFYLNVDMYLFERFILTYLSNLPFSILIRWIIGDKGWLEMNLEMHFIRSLASFYI